MIRLRCLLGEMQTTMDTTERFEMVLNGPNVLMEVHGFSI